MKDEDFHPEAGNFASSFGNYCILVSYGEEEQEGVKIFVQIIYARDLHIGYAEVGDSQFINGIPITIYGPDKDLWKIPVLASGHLILKDQNDLKSTRLWLRNKKRFWLHSKKILQICKAAYVRVFDALEMEKKYPNDSLSWFRNQQKNK